MAMTKVLTGKYRTTGMAPLDLSSCSKSEILEYFEASFDLNESLFTGLKDEDAFYKCPDRLRLPLIFYYAHTATVFVNKLMLAGMMTERVNLDFETMFETGVDEMSWDDTENYRMGGSFQWPPLEDTVEFRRLVRNRIRKIIKDTPLQLPITQDSPWWAVMMGVEHEKIHIETSSVLIRQMPITMVTTPPKWKYAPESTGTSINKNPLLRVEGAEVTFGKPEDFPSYGWCVEYGQRTFNVPTFEASKFKVTNREFLQFVKEGGYENSSYWTKEGWNWRCFRQARHPAFWVCTKGCKSGCGAVISSHSHCLPEYFTTTYSEPNINDNDISPPNGGQNGTSNGHQNGTSNGHPNGTSNGHQNGTTNGEQKGNECQPEFKLRVMFDVIEMPWDWPTVVNYHEARAFCAWKGPEFRMLTEAEFNMIQGGALGDPSKGVTSDPVFHKDPQANFRLTFGSSSPVDLYPANDLGFHDVYGNLWEWVEDHFNGLPGYKQHHLYDDYASPCFDARHGLMLGGSWASDGTYNSRFSRMGFRRHFYQHAGFRVARTLPGAGKSPVVMVNTDVYILGAGVEENDLTVPETVGLEVVPMASTNKQFHHETEEFLAAMLALQYGDGGQNDSKALADFCVEKANHYGCPLQNAVQLGCGTGGVGYQLAKTFKEVIGVDYCARYLDAAITLQKTGEFRWPTPVSENDAKKPRTENGTITVNIPADVQRDRLTFKQMTWVPNEIPKVDLVLLDFLDRVSNPKAWWLRLWEIVTDNGIVVVISQKFGKDELSADLNKKFDLLEEQEYQLQNSQGQPKVAMATIWKLKL